MKKKELYLGLGWMAMGLIFLAAGIYGDIHQLKLASISFGFAGAWIGSGVMYLYRYIHWSKAKNREQYEKHLQDEEIAQKDERNIMLREKSGQKAYIFNLMLHWLLFIVACICYAMDWFEPYTRFSMVALSILILIEYISGIVLFQLTAKKY